MGLGDTSTNRGRGRVVMLVDNAVTGDSRVQKVARSAADAGWDVVLLGCSPTDAEQSWCLGSARVLLVPLGGPRTATGTTGLRTWLVARGGLPLRIARLVRRPVEHAQVLFWRTVKGDRAWRWLEPALWRYERAFARVIDELAPDLIHAHDFRMLGVGARAIVRIRATGRPVKLLWDAHEYVPGIKPWRDNARWLPAHRGYVREYAPYADAVVTVSDALAALLQREHNLVERPAVVLNAPAIARPESELGPDVRRMCCLDAATPLLVYVGMAMVQRGLDTIVDALPRLRGVHLALVVHDTSAAYVHWLLDRAARLGVQDRTHLLPYVPHHEVVAFLSTADIGLIPLHRWPNYEVSLNTKYFEYSHARLPIVVSDVKTMADTVRSTGQGEVFRAKDVADFVRAVGAVLADPQRYRAAYDKPGCLLPTWTWKAQAEVLDSIYGRLLPAGSTVMARPDRTPAGHTNEGQVD
jgi:glycosyltransferase involved in cell wall biosynthesis